MTGAKPHVIWLFLDGKPGHENQSLGLLSALSEKIPVEIIRLKPVSFIQAVLSFFTEKNSQFDNLPLPDIVVGAGHKTHLSLLLTKWLYGAHSIVLMKPSLPLFLFDLCLIPEHDGMRSGKNVVKTLGVLNKIRASGPKKENQGVILIGGPSRHYGWDDAVLIERLKSIAGASSEINWLVSDSRRTPVDTTSKLASLGYDNLRFYSCNDVSADWLPAVLSESGYGWVTEDSVSMVYEALTARVAVGLLDIPGKKISRVSRGVEKLIDEGYVMKYSDWLKDKSLRVSKRMNNESERCADEIIRRWHLVH